MPGLFFIKSKKNGHLLPSRTAISSYIARFYAHYSNSKTPKQKFKRREQIMTNTKNGSNQGMVPEARAAMDRFKMEAAAEVGVTTPS